MRYLVALMLLVGCGEEDEPPCYVVTTREILYPEPPRVEFICEECPSGDCSDRSISGAACEFDTLEECEASLPAD